MTLRRISTIAFLCFTTIICLQGQPAPHKPGSEKSITGQMGIPDSVAADTASGTLNVPNVFSPNGDQINDYFEVETDGVTVYEFLVFTKSGTKVFHSRSPRIFWDGRNANGLPQKEGIYYYVIEPTGSGNQSGKAGFIYLFR